MELDGEIINTFWRLNGKGGLRVQWGLSLQDLTAIVRYMDGFYKMDQRLFFLNFKCNRFFLFSFSF